MSAQETVKIDKEMINNTEIRSNWTREEVAELFDQSLFETLFQAQTLHRQYFNANEIQLSTLLNIKTGGCEEDCAYCPQSIKYNTDVEPEKLMDLEAVKIAAQAAKEKGASRFCMGAAWRELKDRDLPKVTAMIKEVKGLGLESCVTLGMITANQASTMKEAGLDYYNHNLDTSESYYENIISTRSYQDRIDTLQNVRDAGINVCCGGILGMGEKEEDRIDLLLSLANMTKHPESVPINVLVKATGTPLENEQDIDPFEVVKIIAVARIMMPASMLRLSAGRTEMNDEHQVLCFMAGANSIFYGEKLLTTSNPQHQRDQALLQRVGMKPA
ncbi:MAG: biotin synthase BioB [Methylococcales bacterium]